MEFAIHNEHEYLLYILNKKYFVLWTKKLAGNFSLTHPNQLKSKTLSNLSCLHSSVPFLKNKTITGLRLLHGDKYYFWPDNNLGNTAGETAKIKPWDNNNDEQDNPLKFQSVSPFFRYNFTGGDAVGTNNKNIAPMITFADCIPLSILDTKHGIVFSVHSGWKSSILNIAGKIIHWMKTEKGCRAQDIVVLIGPSIYSDSYEINADIFNNLSKDKMDKKSEYNIRKKYFYPHKVKKDKFFFDFRQMVYDRINDEGVEYLEKIDIDTYKSEEYSSFRREGEDFTAQAMITGFL